MRARELPSRGYEPNQPFSKWHDFNKHSAVPHVDSRTAHRRTLVVRSKATLAAGPSAMAESINLMGTESETPARRFMRYAQQRRVRDLRQLFALCALVKSLSGLIHALQKERGTSSIYLASSERHFCDHLQQRVAASQSLEREVCNQLESIDSTFEGAALSARFYSSVGYSLLALDTLPDIRMQVETAALEAEFAVKSYSDVIAALLAVGFEAADIVADTETARALIALVNLSQGKEYAGQERAVGGAALSRGPVQSQDKARLQRLASAQERAFRIFTEFASEISAANYRRLAESDDARLLAHYRLSAFESGHEPPVSADDWYELTTRRIDMIKSIEEQTSSDLEQSCLARLNALETTEAGADQVPVPARVAMLIAGIDSTPPTRELEVNLLAADAELPAPLHSIRAVLEAQSRRIDSINTELESTRQALAERKLVERAKGLLMQRRRLSEKDAYTLLRQTAMSQNKRLIEIAEAVVSMAALL